MTRKQFKNTAERIMVAIDVDELSEARKIIESIKDLGVGIKVGNQLGTFESWKAAIDLAHEFGASVFCDTKFKDIPETVKKSSRAITRHQPEFFNIMADNSMAALEGAREGARSAYEEYHLKSLPLILGVTVLTSINDDEARSIYGADSATKVQQFASAAANACRVICSAEEAKMLRSFDTTKDLLLVTPGIRPTWAASGDQSRIVTPRQAIENGADYLVIGRPVTQPPAEIGTPRDALLKSLKK
jgi:orotidine-5'-phosphate decarboxylase